jgi:hypothetical protein
MPDTEIARFNITSDGGTIATPVLRDSHRAACRIVVEGVLRFADQELDAFYAFDPTQRTRKGHDYLRWEPQRPMLESADWDTHRYVFRIPKEWRNPSLAIGLNTEAFVQRFLVSPSEIRTLLTGSLQVTVLQAPVGPPNYWLLSAGIGLPTVAVGMALRRRMLFAGLDTDLRTQLERIWEKHRLAARSVRPEQERAFPLRRRLDALRDAAPTAVRELQRLRKAQPLLHASGEKLAAQYQSNLNAIEAALESTYLGLQHTGAARGEHETQIARELDAAVTAISEVSEIARVRAV